MNLQGTPISSKLDWSEPHGSSSDPLTKETPGALVGATGAGQKEVYFKTDYYRKRAEAATILGQAIADCHRDDATIILEAALQGLRVGQPRPALFGLMAEARDWATFAMRAELKAYVRASFDSLSQTDRAAFLRYVSARA
jgi:hypothetical protein